MKEMRLRIMTILKLRWQNKLRFVLSLTFDFLERKQSKNKNVAQKMNDSLFLSLYSVYETLL